MELITDYNCDHMHSDIQSLFARSAKFRLVLSGGLSLDKFVETNTFLQLKLIARSIFHEIETLRNFTEIGIICAWIYKLRWNQYLSDEHFFLYVKRADTILSGAFFFLNVHTKDPLTNDLIALMWGIQCLQSVQTCDIGSLRLRLSPMVANTLYKAWRMHAKKRFSTHAQFTRIGNKGLGKDIARRAHRRYTPIGSGALLMHRVFRNDQDATAYKKYAKEPAQYDFLFKLQPVGLNDHWLQSCMHLNYYFAQFILRIGFKHAYHKKSLLFKLAESEYGVYKTPSRREHLSALPHDLRKSLLRLLYILKREHPSFFRQMRIDYLKRITQYRISIGLIWETNNWHLNNVAVPLGTFVKHIHEHWHRLCRGLKHEPALQHIASLIDIIVSDDVQHLSFRREGLEILVDLSHGKSEPVSMGMYQLNPMKSIYLTLYSKLLHTVRCIGDLIF